MNIFDVITTIILLYGLINGFIKGFVVEVAILSNQFVNPFVPWTASHYALVLSSIIHGIVYATYVWLVTRVGVVFSAQVSYFVTLAGVLWSMIILDEVHSKFIWMSLICMILGMTLVKPRSH